MTRSCAFSNRVQRVSGARARFSAMVRIRQLQGSVPLDLAADDPFPTGADGILRFSIFHSNEQALRHAVDHMDVVQRTSRDRPLIKRALKALKNAMATRAADVSARSIELE